MNPTSAPDCLIVGAGVVGLSLADELARHGMKVTLIDRQEPGRGASWAGAGILPAVQRAAAMHPWEQLLALGHELHAVWAERLRAETGIDTGYRRCGGIHVATTAGEAAALAGWAAIRREHGVVVERLELAALEQVEPQLAAARTTAPLLAAYCTPDEAQLRNPWHLRALAVACARRGVTILGDRAVQGWEIRAGRLEGVQTTAGLLRAGRYCVTAGAWTRLLLDDLGITTGMLPVRGQMVLLRCAARPLRQIVNLGPRYLVARDDGRVLVGSTQEEVGFDQRTTEAGIRGLLALAHRLVPALRDAQLEASWAGLRPGSFDGFPYMGELPQLRNAYVAAGHFRSGLHVSPAVALVMGQLLRAMPPQIDLRPFRVARG